jgi:predicted 3-demethylubiquinone-9 3-methyltransferase (glyoxalase superfamily)
MGSSHVQDIAMSVVRRRGRGGRESLCFAPSKLANRSRAEERDDSPAGKAGTVLVVDFTLAGQRFMALNGGTRFEYTHAISFHVDCADQAEVDRLWDALSNGGSVEQCGWLKDRYGVSWQIVPTVLGQMLGDPDQAKAQRVMQAMLQMVKLDIEGLRRAYAGAPVEGS